MRARLTPILFVIVALACAARGADRVLSPATVDAAVAIQEALAKDSLNGVRANAEVLEKQGTELGATGAKIAAAARQLKDASKIADARAAFGALSDAIVAHMDAAKLALPNDKVRIAFCPMAGKPWLQKDGPIQNPYYSTEMPTCGSFRK